MERAFKLPDLGEGVHEGEILAVHVSSGQNIAEGDVVLTVETDKAAVEIPSPYTGTVSEIRVRAGDLVKVGQVMLTFNGGGPKPAGLPGRAAGDESGTPGKEMPGPIEAAQERRQGPPPVVRPADGARNGVAPGKAATGLTVPEGIAARPRGPVPASPATRRLARELGVDLHQVPASGPHGLVTAEDVRAFAASSEATGAAPQAPPQPAAAPPGEPETREKAPESLPGGPAAPAPELPDFSRWGPVERVPVRSIRRATARRMALSWSQIPHVSSQDSADITRLSQFRSKHRESIEKQGGRLTLTIFALKAAAAALKRFPNFNASLDVRSGEIIRKQYIHIGVAVNAPDGLVVPVVRDVDRKSLRDLALELPGLLSRTRERRVGRDELQGGTFTITNAGAMGGGTFTPLINFPEVAILGLGQARMQPAAVADEAGDYSLEPRLIMPLVVCVDHRVLDGADAIGFLKLVVDLLEDPEQLLLSAV